MKGIRDIYAASELTGLLRKVHSYVDNLADFVGETEFLLKHPFQRYRIKPALSYSEAGFVRL